MNGRVEVVGSRPLMFVAHGTIEVDGVLDLTATAMARAVADRVDTLESNRPPSTRDDGVHRGKRGCRAGRTSTADDGETAGQSGLPSALAALGGTRARSNGDDGGRDGGRGGARGSPATTPDSDPDGAAGGGGGSVGVVTVGTVGAIPIQGQFSPAVVPFVLSAL